MKFGNRYEGVGHTPREARAEAIQKFLNRTDGTENNKKYTFKHHFDPPPSGPINGKCLVRRGF